MKTIQIDDDVFTKLVAALNAAGATTVPPQQTQQPPTVSVDVSLWKLAGYTVRLIDLEWQRHANQRTQVLDILPTEVVLARFTSPAVGEAPQNAGISIVEASGWPVCTRTVTVADTPYSLAPLAPPVVNVSPVISLLSNMRLVHTGLGANIRQPGVCELAPSTVYYMAITHRNADGSISLPSGKLGGININFQG